MTRTFIALEQDAEQQRFLSTIIRQGEQLLPDLRWVDQAGIHLTLAFLGTLTDAQLVLAEMATVEAAESAQPFAYRLSGLGTFGPPRQPRVLWMGVSEPSGVLHTVHQALAGTLEERGFVTEKRPFSPHLTLARIKAPLLPDQVQILQRLLAHQQNISPQYHVRHLAVMKSELARTGAQYTCLRTAPLRPARL